MKRLFILFLILFASLAYAQDEIPAESTGTVYRVDMVDMIHKGTTSLLEMSIEQALKGNAEALLIRLDTPGGMLDATRDIVQLLLNAPLPIIVYVAPSGAHAGSAGVMITMAGHIAAMAPGTNIGAATPVSPQGELPEAMKKKVTNDTAAFVEAIAQQRERNTEWAIKAVRDAESVTDKNALELNVIDFIATSVDDLLNQAHGKKVKVDNKEVTLNTKDAKIIDVKLGTKQKMQIKLANPSLAFIFLLLAILGIYVEFSHPGMIVPGALGVLAGVLFLFSIQVLPFNYLGLLLIAVGFVCFALEMKFTSYGLLTIAGLAGLTVGSLIIFDVPEKVFDPRSLSLRVPLSLVLPATITMGAIVMGVMYAVIRTQMTQVKTADEGMVGEIGEVRIAGGLVKPAQVFLHGELWVAKSNNDLAVGDQVKVVSCTNLLVNVEKI